MRLTKRKQIMNHLYRGKPPSLACTSAQHVNSLWFCGHLLQKSLAIYLGMPCCSGIIYLCSTTASDIVDLKIDIKKIFLTHKFDCDECTTVSFALIKSMSLIYCNTYIERQSRLQTNLKSEIAEKNLKTFMQKLD